MKIKKRKTTLSASIINVIVLTLIIFSILVSVIGSIGYAEALKSEYAQSTYRMADTAAALINGDKLEKYLNEGEDEEYRETMEMLDIYCHKIYVSLIYVIVVDQSDYGRFRSMFNTVYNEVDDTNYDPWELGHERETTNDDYREKYRRIYEEGSDFETVYRLHITDGHKQHITTLVPVKDSSGKVVGILCMQRPISELRNQIIQYLIVIAALAIVLSVISAIAVLKHNKKHFVMPIKKISQEASRFAKGDLEVRKLDVDSSIEEIAELSSAIEKLGEDMIKYIKNLTTITGERERIAAELSIASTIQENSIPNKFPAFTDRTDFDIYGSMTPAKAVGGDFYNFFLIDDDHLVVLIGDVSGKGIPASLFMMVSNILISESVHMGETPARVFNFVNNRICSHNEADMFVTVWLGIIELSTGKVVAANAGHDNPAIYRKDGSFELLNNNNHGLVIGAIEDATYTDFEFTLGEGDKLFLYTDGVPEATDKNNNMFTLDGMLMALNKYKNGSPEEILEGVNSQVNDFVGDAPQFDDLTMLCVELKKRDSSKKITVQASNDKLDEVIEFIDEILDENGCSMKTKMKIDLSVEEIFVNIANYAYTDKTGDVHISAEVKNGEIIIVFKDSGIPYNPLEKEDPDISLSAEERAIGGLGIFLVKKNMDSVSYKSENNNNVFTITKRIQE